MKSTVWQIGICGTFDVRNYGDLLFPLLAAAELGPRLGAVRVRPFSYRAKAAGGWPYDVESVTDLPERIQELDALLIGGGHLIRFDKFVAPDYVPPVPEIHHPTGYWLSPALLALQNNVPLIWNAPGGNDDLHPEWARPLLDVALAHSRYAAFRDQKTVASLAGCTTAPLLSVPDTAFGLKCLRDLAGPPSAELADLMRRSGITGPYLVIQAMHGMKSLAGALAANGARLQGRQVVALPVGPDLGEQHENLESDRQLLIRLPEWPSPGVIAELIGRSDAAIGHSYHLMISSLTAGVPVFTRQNFDFGKYTGLRGLPGIFSLPAAADEGLDLIVRHVGRVAVSAPVHAATDAVASHWDQVAAAIRKSGPQTSAVLNRLWQVIPAVYEMTDDQPPSSITAGRVAQLEAEAGALRAQRDELKASRSWRITAPLRKVADLLNFGKSVD